MNGGIIVPENVTWPAASIPPLLMGSGLWPAGLFGVVDLYELGGPVVSS